MATSDGKQFNFDVFISYRHQEPDKSWVRETLLPRLEAAGVRVFIDVAQFDIGEVLVAEMERAVRQSRFTLAVVSPAYLAGDFANFENVIALESEEDRDRLLTVLLEPCDLPPRLGSRLYFDMTDDTAFEANCSELCSMLKPRKLFLVYADTAEDKEWVKECLKPALGPAAWIVEKKDLKPGAYKEEETDRLISNSDHNLLVLSPAFFDDKWTSEVLKRVSHLSLEDPNKRPSFLKRRSCALPPAIKSRVVLDFTESSDWASEFTRLRESLELPEPPKSKTIKCPYPGMVPYNEKDANFFYGRDDKINEALDKLRHQNVLFVIGPSGSGKSSLVFAGIIPKLKARDPGEWLVKSFRPGDTPVEALQKSLALPSVPSNTEIKDLIDTDCISALLAKQQPSAQQLLLVIDQLEELFALAKTEQQASFFSSIKALFSMQSCKIILTMRADFYPDLMKCDLWSMAQDARLEVTALKGDSLAEALEKPAKHEGVYLEGALRERLLADAAEEPGVLPLLQETMQSLWKKLEQHWLTLDEYEQLGRDGRTGLAVALSDKADGTLNSLPNERHKMIARRIFLRLIQFGAGRSDTRRQQVKTDLMSQEDDKDVFEKTIQHLASNRLLTLSSDLDNDNSQTGEPNIKVDISHESLISGWPKLQEWIRDWRKLEPTHRDLEEQVMRWEKSVKQGKKSGLLDEEELLIAEKWLKKENAKNLEYISGLSRLVSVSRNKIDRIKKLKLGVALGFLILFMVTLWQLGESEYHRNNFRAGKLAATAELIRDENPKQLLLSLLIAIESITPELRTGFSNWMWLPLRKVESWVGSPIFGKISTLDGSRILHKDLAVLAKSTMLGLNVGIKIKAIEYSPDGKLVASAQGNQVCTWEVTSARKLFCLPHKAKVTSLVFGNDNSRLFTASSDKKVLGWSTETGKQLWSSASEHSVKTLVLNNEGNFLAGADGNKVQIWQMRDGRKGADFSHEKSVQAIAFVTDSGFMAVANKDRVIVWDIDTGRKYLTLPFDATVQTLVFSPDGHFLAAKKSNTVMVWDILNKKQTFDAEHKDPVYKIAFDSTSEYLATGGKDGIARVWKLSDNSLLFAMAHGLRKVTVSFGKDKKHKITPPGAVFDISFSEDGRYLATASSDYTARIWDLKRGGQEYLRMVHDETVKQIVFDPKSETVATATKKTGVWLSRLNRGDELARLNHDSFVTVVSFPLNGRYLCTKDENDNTHLWEIDNGKKISKNSPMCIANGSSEQTSKFTAKTTDTNNKVSIIQDGKEIAWVIHNGVDVAAISSDGKFLATSDGGQVQMWEWYSRGLLFWKTEKFIKMSAFTHEQGGINDMTFSPDNRYLATAGSDTTARVWFWRNADLIERSCKRLTKNLSQSEWNEYIGDGVYRKTCPELP